MFCHGVVRLKKIQIFTKIIHFTLTCVFAFLFRWERNVSRSVRGKRLSNVMKRFLFSRLVGLEVTRDASRISVFSLPVRSKTCKWCWENFKTRIQLSEGGLSIHSIHLFETITQISSIGGMGRSILFIYTSSINFP